MKIAVIGSGISGLGVSTLLDKHHDVTLFEKNTLCGGHSRTIDVSCLRNGKTINQKVDTGFIVFNKRNYPNLVGLFNMVKVPYEKSDMSFAVSVKNSWLEYTTKNIFANPLNFLKPRFLFMLYEVFKFMRLGRKFVQKPTEESLADFLNRYKFSDFFRRYYVLPIGGAIWSCSTEIMMQFPSKSFFRFFENHGLLTVNNQPQWYTVTDGSRSYVETLLSHFGGTVKTSSDVKSVAQKDGAFEVVYGNSERTIFDQVVFACHADQAFEIITDKTKNENKILGAFDYQKNTVITHQDENLMPRRKSCWASWVYLSGTDKDSREHMSLSYWMNNLQNFKTDKPVLVTLNPDKRPHVDSILDEHIFTHPIFDGKAVNAQSSIKEIQGKRGIWFCGAYQRYGFHEDGLLSAVNVVKQMGHTIPWE